MKYYLEIVDIDHKYWVPMRKTLVTVSSRWTHDDCIDHGSEAEWSRLSQG